MPIVVSAQNLSYDLLPDITATRNIGSVSQVWNQAWLTTVKTGVWNGSVITPVYGGTGVANNAASTITISGAFGLTVTLTAATSVTLPTSGTLVSTTVSTLSSLSSIGTITVGIWNGTIIAPAYGGTGIANNAASTITISGAFALTLTLTAATALTLPTSGTVVVSTVTTLSALASIGTITTGVWNGSVITPVYGGTGVANNAASTITITGAYGLTLTLTAATALTLPTSGTVATLAGSEEFTNKTLTSAVGKGTWTASGVWTLPAFTLGGNVLPNADISLVLGSASFRLLNFFSGNATINNVSIPGSLTLSAAANISLDTVTGTQIGTAITQKMGFYGATPIAQRAGAAQAAVATTGSTNVSPYGYTTAAQADAIVTLVNELRAWAVAQGLIKGSA